MNAIYWVNLHGRAQLELVVLDPGLNSVGGHHRSLFDKLCSVVANDETPGSVQIYGGKNLSSEMAEDLPQKNFKVFSFFSQPLYKFYSNRPTLAEANEYVIDLSREYKAALENSALVLSAVRNGKKEEAVIRENKVVVLYPAVQWEHIIALDLALSDISPLVGDVEFVHKLCLMYNPGRDITGAIINFSEWCGYSIACRSIQRKKNVRLFASDYELKNHFSFLPIDGTEFKLHPQYLFDLNCIAKASLDDLDFSKKIGLYFGDAKIEKGFSRVPEMLRELLKILDCVDEVFIQFSCENMTGFIQKAANEIYEISMSDQRVKVFDSYLPQDQINSIFDHLTHFIFTYDCKHYQNKSSGILWLLQPASCDLLFFGESWLSREAERLGCQFTVIDNLPVQQAVGLKGFAEFLNRTPEKRSRRKNELRAADGFYASELFAPFLPWVLDI